MTCGKAAADVVSNDSSAPHVVVQQARPITAALSDFATGATEQNQVYVGNRLLYHVGGEEMDPLRNGRVAWQLAVQLFLFTFGPLVAAGHRCSAIGSFMFAVGAALGIGLIRGLGVLALVLCALAYAAWFVCMIVGFFRNVPVRNAEWLMFLDDKGPAAPAVFAHIAGALQRRGTPAETIRVKRVPIPKGGHRDMLEVRFRRYFIGYVTAYEFGNDLHIGWNFYVAALAASGTYCWTIGSDAQRHPRATDRAAHPRALRAGQDDARGAARGRPARAWTLPASGAAMTAALPADVPVDALAASRARRRPGLFAN